MLKKNAGTQNEGGRDTKANVEEVDKTKIEDKRETKTKGEKAELRIRPLRGAHMSRVRLKLGVIRGGAYHRIMVETMEVRRREYQAKSNGCRGGNQT